MDTLTPILLLIGLILVIALVMPRLGVTIEQLLEDLW